VNDVARNSKRNSGKRKANRKNGRRANNLLPVTVGNRPLEELELSEADRAVLAEVNENRKAIVALGKIALDHERRIGSLEEAIGELAGEDFEEPIEVEAE